MQERAGFFRSPGVGRVLAVKGMRLRPDMGEGLLDAARGQLKPGFGGFGRAGRDGGLCDPIPHRPLDQAEVVPMATDDEFGAHQPDQIGERGQRHVLRVEKCFRHGGLRLRVEKLCGGSLYLKLLTVTSRSRDRDAARACVFIMGPSDRAAAIPLSRRNGVCRASRRLFLSMAVNPPSLVYGSPCYAWIRKAMTDQRHGARRFVPRCEEEPRRIRSIGGADRESHRSPGHNRYRIRPTDQPARARTRGSRCGGSGRAKAAARPRAPRRATLMGGAAPEPVSYPCCCLLRLLCAPDSFVIGLASPLVLPSTPSAPSATICRLPA